MNADDDGGSARLNFFPLFTKGRKRGRTWKIYLLILGGLSLILSSCREESSLYSYTKTNHKLRLGKVYNGKAIWRDPYIIMDTNFVPADPFPMPLAIINTCLISLGSTDYPACSGHAQKVGDLSQLWGIYRKFCVN